MKVIPYGRQFIDQSDIDEVVKTLKSDFLTTGPKVDAFESHLKEVLNVKYAVAISNGTAALHAACAAAGITEGDEVIVPAITFAASANAVLYCGGKPVFADIDLDTYTISIESIEKLITDKTKAIIPVHYMGHICDMSSIHVIAQKHNLIVIEDGSHVLGAKYKNEPVTCAGDMMTISFHPVKHITTGEGGVILTNSYDLYKKLKLFRSHGITRLNKDESTFEEPWYYEQQMLGYNYRITDIQCALGISQLKKLDLFMEKRRQIVDKYYQSLREFENVILPPLNDNFESAWHIFVIRIKLNKINKTRLEVFNEFREKGILVNVHYIPVYRHPYYRDHGYADTYCENAEKLYESMITLPLFPLLKDEEQDYIIKVVKEVIV